MRLRLHPSAIGWIGLAVYVSLWDLYAPETLSRGFHTASRHPRLRPLTFLAWAALTAHLFTGYTPLQRKDRPHESVPSRPDEGQTGVQLRIIRLSDSHAP